VKAVMLSSTPFKLNRYEPSALGSIDPESEDKLKSQLLADASAGEFELFDVIQAVTTIVRRKHSTTIDHFLIFTTQV
jgi:hypothetical protein